MNDLKKRVIENIDLEEAKYVNLSDSIFDYAETAFRETKSSEVLMDALEMEGFKVEKGIGEVDTAFKATYGSGEPVIGILGEYDALNAMSQKANCFVKEESEEGKPGHACGHNLLGVASLAAAVSVKEYLEEVGEDKGTIVYYGCPAEEGGSGKGFMARGGAFQELDSAITWHPSTINIVPPNSTLANYQMKFKFKGIASHASNAPHLGRSALDAVEVMNNGVQYLREHIIPEARIHYAILNTGGTAPNIVQAEAEVVYLIRAPKESQLREIYKRVQNIAKGAALITDTTYEEHGFSAVYNIIPNFTLSEVLQKNLEEQGVPEYTEEERQYADKINSTIEKPNRLIETVASVMGPRGREWVKPYRNKPLNELIVPFVKSNYVISSSSDVGDVSWICPLTQVATVTMASGTPGHSWQLAAQGKSSIAIKGMLLAAKSMGGTAIDLIENPEIVIKAKEEHIENLDGEKYEVVMPESSTPLGVIS